MNERNTIVALRPCGCWVVAMSDIPEAVKDNAKEVARCMRQGYRIDRCAAEDIRSGKLPMQCPACHPEATLPGVEE